MGRKLTEEEKAVRKVVRDKKKAEQAIKDREQNRLDLLERDLKDLRLDHINEPTYFFKVGDRVQRGNIKQSIVVGVLDGGKIYYLDETRQKDRDNPERSDNAYEAWMNLRPYVNYKENPPKHYSFLSEVDHVRQISYLQQDISSLLFRNYGNYAGIDDEPDYQRDLVWNLEDKVALIDSIFKKIDIGKFTFIKRDYDYDNPYAKGLEVLDGKQRLNAIIDFYEDRFEYRGKTFTQLHPADRGWFRRSPVSVGETAPMTDREKYEYFLRLNVGGKSQDPDHIEYVRGLLDE